MDNESFKLAVRHHMGLIPYDELHKEKCRMCVTQTKFAEDHDHFHSCSKHKRTVGSARHSDLMSAVMKLARSVGFYASREPNDHMRPAGQHMRDEGFNSHADILLLKHNLKYYVDVSVVRSTQASKLKQQSNPTTPLQAAGYRAKSKHKKYDEICRVNGYQMVPFVIESTGALAPEGRQLLKLLSEHASDSDLSPREWLAHAYNYISVVLQNGNARIAQGGVHAHSIDQSRWEGKKNSHIKWLRARSHKQSHAKDISLTPAKQQIRSSHNEPHSKSLRQQSTRSVRIDPTIQLQSVVARADERAIVELDIASDTSVSSDSSDEGSEYRPHTQSRTSQCINRPTRPPLTHMRGQLRTVSKHIATHSQPHPLDSDLMNHDRGGVPVSPSDRWRPSTRSFTDLTLTAGISRQ